ncbi:MAG TPA: tetratricopeptide repeat protein [Planctomycetota bacterium]
MDAPENIPLEDAVARGLIPCSACGAKGAGVKRVEGKPHFLCGTCAKKGRSTSWVALGIVLIGVVGVAWWLKPSTSAAPPRGSDWFVQADGLLRAGKYPEARALLEGRAKETPEDARVHFLLGQCLLAMGAAEGAHAAFVAAAAADKDAVPVNSLWAGIALQRLGRSAEALPLLQPTAAGPKFEERRRAALVECLLDLERYEEALNAIGNDPGMLWERHRALRYGNKPSAAEALETQADPKDAWTFRGTRLREEGDFDGARAVLEKRRQEAPEDRPRLARAELSVAVETNDLPRLEALAAELAADPRHFAEGLWFRAMGRLLAGKPAEARAIAEEFLAKTHPELSSIRLERLQMRFLTGQATAADVEAEAKRTGRVRANDLYWFLALATGDRAWAEKGFTETPGRNFPYHALKRLAGK